MTEHTEHLRQKALRTLARLATTDSDFLTGVRTDAELTLWRYGFALNPEEMRFVTNYLTDHGNLSDAEVVRHLEGELRKDRWF